MLNMPNLNPECAETLLDNDVSTKRGDQRKIEANHPGWFLKEWFAHELFALAPLQNVLCGFAG